MTKEIHSPLRPLLIIFAALSAFFITGKAWLVKSGIDLTLVVIGNLLLFAVSMSAYIILQKSLKSPNPHAFVRAVNTGFILKFMVIAIAAFIYIYLAGKNLNKPGLLVCAGIYIIYTTVETMALMKTLKKRKNA